MITLAERRFPVRIRLAVPPGGLGQRYTHLTAWLDENCGADGWALTSAGTRGVLNNAISIYFADATLAGAFVARWCVGAKAETAGGVFQVREDEAGNSDRGGSASDALTVLSAGLRQGCSRSNRGSSGLVEFPRFPSALR